MMSNGGFGILLWLCVIGAFVWFAWLDDSEFRYEFQYKDAEVTFDDKPHDCEFLTAPLGRKNCSYEKEVSIVQFSRDIKTGAAIISYDGGVTWNGNRGGPMNGKRVHVYWVKTAD